MPVALSPSDPVTPLAEPALSRRGFLRLGAVGSSLLSAAGAATMSGCAAEDTPRLDGYHPRVLTSREYSVLAMFCDHMLDAAGRLTADQAGVARRIDKELAFHDGTQLVDDVKNALLVLEHGTFLSAYASRFSRLRSRERATYLDGLQRSRIQFRRDALSGLRLLAVFFYYTDERTWNDIHYAGPLAKRKLPESANALEAIA